MQARRLVHHDAHGLPCAMDRHIATRERVPEQLKRGHEPRVSRDRPLGYSIDNVSKTRCEDARHQLEALHHKAGNLLFRPHGTFLLGLDPELVGLGVDGLLQEQIHLFSSKHVLQSWGRDSSTGLSGKSFRYG